MKKVLIDETGDRAGRPQVSADETSKGAFAMSKRRLLADSGDEEEEAGRAPQRPDKANGKQPPAKVAAKGAAVASANHLHSPLVQLLEKCGLKVSSNGATPHSGLLSAAKLSLTQRRRFRLHPRFSGARAPPLRRRTHEGLFASCSYCSPSVRIGHPHGSEEFAQSTCLSTLCFAAHHSIN